MMMDRLKRKDLWERRRIDVTLRFLGGVDTLLRRIREGAGRQQTSLDRARAKLDERRRTLEAEARAVEARPTGAARNAAA